ncbi:MAG TPA: hypothetical protein VHB47_01900 [Thermoanaerobaculia bacterium]|jgi:hypothetical protein|nr:hypothetical protein [Thermoanaerobaculia bacterium]
MKVTISLLAALTLAVAALAIAPAAASAATLFQNDDVTVNMHAYAQGVAVAQNVPDDVRDKNRLYLFVKEARLRWDGTLYGATYDIMLAPGAEDITPNTNSALGLLDFSFEAPVLDAKLKLGQFLVPYSRERLTDDPTMSFADRSIENLGFSWNRDYGFALSKYSGKFAGTFAVMTGGGRDVPQRYLPEKLGFPLVGVRFGYNDGIDKDIYHVSARDLDPGRPKSALYFNGLYTKDTQIGHSTVLNIRATDKNLLIDSNYNPFIARAPFSLATIWQAGADAAYRAPLGALVFNAEGQVDYSHFDNKYGQLSLKGGRVQAGVSKNKWEVNLRYAALFLDTRMAFVSSGVAYPITKDKAPLQELTPSITYHYRPGIQVTVDAPYLIKMLIFKENTIGSYVMSEQPDQVTVIKPGTTAGTGSDVRKNVAEARLMVQLGF